MEKQEREKKNYNRIPTRFDIIAQAGGERERRIRPGWFGQLLAAAAPLSLPPAPSCYVWHRCCCCYALLLQVQFFVQTRSLDPGNCARPNHQRI